jgi:glyoxylase I family protein
MPINIQGMAPLLQVFDMPTSIKFYRDILGFAVVGSSGTGDDVGWVLLRLNNTELMLNTAYERHERPASPDHIRIAAHADTSIYFGCPDTDAACNYLYAHGINVKKPIITKYGWKALYLTDPDGYSLCFHWPLQDMKNN